MKNRYISVSTDPIKEYQRITEYAKEMQGNADFLHCDIMDGVFVENKTYDHQLLKNINDHSLIMLDVHLMCDEPLKSIDDYLKVGANIITIHYEAFKDKNDIIEAITKIKKGKALAGLAIKPSTNLQDVKIYVHDFDVILVMSVEPGASGQKFMTSAIDRVKALAQLREENDYKYKIEVDGGVNPEIAQKLFEAGADMIVSGSFVYKSHDKLEAIEQLRRG